MKLPSSSSCYKVGYWVYHVFFFVNRFNSIYEQEARKSFLSAQKEVDAPSIMSEVTKYWVYYVFLLKGVRDEVT